MLRSANPALRPGTFTRFAAAPASSATMTIAGTANKTLVFLGLVVLAAAVAWRRFDQQGWPAVAPWLTGGAIAGLVLAFVTVFKPTWAMITGSLYAVAEGLVIGVLSALLESQYPGIVVNAAALTFGTLFALLLAYRVRLIEATENLKLGVFAATVGICLVYALSAILNLFGAGMPYIHGSGWIGIGFSVFVVVIAALNLVMDFDFIEEGAARGAPKYMEWYAAFGLTVTLVWLYIEILRLLAKLRRR